MQRFVLSPLLLAALALPGAGLLTQASCKKEAAVSETPPAADAEMKKVVINVFGMT